MMRCIRNWNGALVSALICLGVAQGFANDTALKAELEAEEAKLENLKAEIEKIQEDIKVAKDTVKEKEAGSEGSGDSEKDKFINEVMNLEDKVREMATLLDAYRKGFYVSTTLKKGESLGDVRQSDGTVLSNVVFDSVSREGVKVKHQSGVAVFAGDQVPPVLEDKVNVPPHTGEVEIDTGALFAEKPNSLLPSDVLKAEREKAEAEKIAARKKDYEEYLARNLERREGRIEKSKELAAATAEKQMSREQTAQRFLEINSEVQNLNIERKEWDRKLNDELRNRIKKQEEFDGKKIKPDPRVMESELGFIDKAIESHRAEIKRIDDQLRKLREETKSLR